MSAELAAAGAPGKIIPWRWPLSIAVVLALHGLTLWWLQQARAVEDAVIPSEAVLIDLTRPAPPVTPEALPAPVIPPPVQQAPSQPTLTDPVPEPPPPTPAVEAAPLPTPPPLVALPKPEVVLPRPVPRSPARQRPPVVRPQSHLAAPQPPAPVRAEPTRPGLSTAQPPAAAAPVAPASAEAAANWVSKLAAHLLRFRHYPPDAERRGMTGVVMMRFSVDAAGRLISSSMVRSSGHDMLDEEAEAWLRRAQPLPPPPSDKVAPAQIVVPLNFVLN